MNQYDVEGILLERLKHPSDPKTTAILAIAFNLGRLADQQERTANYIQHLGFNQQGREPGCLEMLAMNLSELTAAVRDLKSDE